MSDRILPRVAYAAPSFLSPTATIRIASSGNGGRNAASLKTATLSLNKFVRSALKHKPPSVTRNTDTISWRPPPLPNEPHALRRTSHGVGGQLEVADKRDRANSVPGVGVQFMNHTGEPLRYWTRNCMKLCFTGPAVLIGGNFHRQNHANIMPPPRRR